LERSGGSRLVGGAADLGHFVPQIRRQRAGRVDRKHPGGTGVGPGDQANQEHLRMTFPEDVESPPVRRYRTGGPA
jgi:hypothetical protein